MRAFDKKKIYRQFVKAQVQDGRVPNAAGQWVTSINETNMANHLRAGHGAKGRNR